MLLYIHILNIIFYLHIPLSGHDAELAVFPSCPVMKKCLKLSLTIPLLKPEINSTSLLFFLTSVTHKAQLTHKTQ